MDKIEWLVLQRQLFTFLLVFGGARLAINLEGFKIIVVRARINNLKINLKYRWISKDNFKMAALSLFKPISSRFLRFHTITAERFFETNWKFVCKLINVLLFYKSSSRMKLIHWILNRFEMYVVSNNSRPL